MFWRFFICCTRYVFFRICLHQKHSWQRHAKILAKVSWVEIMNIAINARFLCRLFAICENGNDIKLPLTIENV